MSLGMSQQAVILHHFCLQVSVWVPALTSLNEGLWPGSVSQIKPFPPLVASCLGCFITATERKPEQHACQQLKITFPCQFLPSFPPRWVEGVQGCFAGVLPWRVVSVSLSIGQQWLFRPFACFHNELSDSADFTSCYLKHILMLINFTKWQEGYMSPGD